MVIIGTRSRATASRKKELKGLVVLRPLTRCCVPSIADNGPIANDGLLRPNQVVRKRRRNRHGDDPATAGRATAIEERARPNFPGGAVAAGTRIKRGCKSRHPQPLNKPMGHGGSLSFSRNDRSNRESCRARLNPSRRVPNSLEAESHSPHFYPSKNRTNRINQFMLAVPAKKEIS